MLDQVGGLERKRVGRNRTARQTSHDRSARRMGSAAGAERWTVSNSASAECESGPAAWPAPADGDEDHFQRLGGCWRWRAGRRPSGRPRWARRFSGEQADARATRCVDMILVDEDTGLGGRSLIQLTQASPRPSALDPAGRRQPRMLSPQTAHAPSTASAASSTSGTSALAPRRPGEPPDDLERRSSRWRLDLSSDEVAVERQQIALHGPPSAPGERLAELRDVLLGDREPRFAASLGLRGARPRSLNETATGSRAVCPFRPRRGADPRPARHRQDDDRGRVIRQAVRRGDKVLACARATWRSTTSSSGCWRPASGRCGWGTRPACCPSCATTRWTCWSKNTPTCGWPASWSKRRWASSAEAERYTRAKPEPGARGETRAGGQVAAGRRPAAGTQAVEHILDTADVLCATTTGLDGELLGPRRFDLAVIDEACQSTEPGCWIPLLRVRPRGAGRRPLPVAADGGQPGGRGRGFRREPVRAADRPSTGRRSPGG